MEVVSLLAPVEGGQPSGVELRNDGRFHALERLLDAADSSVRLKGDGTINEAAPAVAWQQIMDEGRALSADGRDLRLLVILVRAAYGTEGFEGLRDGLDLLTRTLSDHWDTLHPALRDRPDPKMAVLPRSNALRQLENDENGLLGDLRWGFVLTPRGIGPISGDDLAKAGLNDFEMLNRAASGLSQAEKDALVSRHGQRVNRVSAATRALATEEAERADALIAVIAACEAGLRSLCAAFDSGAGLPEGQGLILPELLDFLERARASLEAGRAAVAGRAAPEAPATTPATMPGATGAAAPATAAVPAVDGAIRNRSDVETALDRIVEFYERTEPSSPIPHLARRMRRMVAMDFLELMEEIAPSGLKEFRNIAGVDDKKK
ncbi:ImpA family type VI secretion system protein [Maritimibacter alkaliphilus]|uniref:type VI secretion system protein TssA n=1 Tax=Maritimibacter alkaliphilus TaxID=404236 RepID=UPI001C97AFBF|nr:type VI secretion system ImpA family N-terminal domain-containing protein [Maritimibacter alkaliphilus]MBY6089212.1 type VI secretion system ImpA family N-terminal domain-containing protein [Maritimibacter alkaliphilus]